MCFFFFVLITGCTRQLIPTLTIPLGTCILLATPSNLFKPIRRNYIVFMPLLVYRDIPVPVSWTTCPLVICSVLTCVEIPYSGTNIMGRCDSTTSQELELFESKKNVKTCNWFFSVSYPFLVLARVMFILSAFLMLGKETIGAPQGKSKYESLLSSMKASAKRKRNGK